MTLDQVQNIANEYDGWEHELLNALINIARGACATLDVAHRIDSPAAKMIRQHLEIPFRALGRISP